MISLICGSLCSCCPSSLGTTGPRQLPRLPSHGHSRARCSPSTLAGMRSRPRSTSSSISSNTSKVRASKDRHGRLLVRCCASLPQSMCQCLHASSVVATLWQQQHYCHISAALKDAAGYPNTMCSQHKHQGSMQPTGDVPVRVHVPRRLPPHTLLKGANLCWPFDQTVLCL